MNFVNAALLSTLAVIASGALALKSEAAPLPTNIATMKAALDAPVVQVRYGGWHGGWATISRPRDRRRSTHGT
jgi:hypothetical protein